MIEKEIRNPNFLEDLHNSDDYKRTEKLIQDFKNLKKERNPFYLNIKNLEDILKWKLGEKQYGRQRKIREKLREEHVKSITELAFKITHDNEEYEAELKLNLLKSLAGIGMGVASAILTLCYPERYTVIDYRGWIVLFNKDKHIFTTKDYLIYLKRIKGIAEKLEWIPQETDLAIWYYYSIKYPNRKQIDEM